MTGERRGRTPDRCLGRRNLRRRTSSAAGGERPYPDNPFAGDHLDLAETLMAVMNRRTIRAWHYTRLTDAEADRLRQDGIVLPSSESIRARLDAQVAAGAFSPEIADALHAASPSQRGQAEIRSGRFWMVSHPPRHPGRRSRTAAWKLGRRRRLLLALRPRAPGPRGLHRARPRPRDRGAFVDKPARLLGRRSCHGRLRPLQRIQPGGEGLRSLCRRASAARGGAGDPYRGDPAFERIGNGYPLRDIDADRGRWDAIEAQIARRRR